MVRIDPCHGSDPGSIPGSFVFFLFFFAVFLPGTFFNIFLPSPENDFKVYQSS